MNMCSSFLSLFRRRGSGGGTKQISHHHSHRKHTSADLSGLSELQVPPPIENRDGSPIYRHHTLEENFERASQGEEVDAQDENEEILVRHHTLEENLELAEELSREMRRQSREMRRQSQELRRQATDEKTRLSPNEHAEQAKQHH